MKYVNPIKVIFSLTENGESRFAFASVSCFLPGRDFKMGVRVEIYMFC